MRFRLIPRDEAFFPLFDEAAGNVVECSHLLRDLFDDLADAGARADRIAACEARGDELTHTILQRLNQSFVPPFDREDIHTLVEELDDVVDDISAAADLLVLHRVGVALPEMQELAGILVRAAEACASVVGKLRTLRDVDTDLEEIDRLETEADHVYRQLVARLFSGELDSFEVLKSKDVVESLERSVNSIEKISDTVESIVLKHA